MRLFLALACCLLCGNIAACQSEQVTMPATASIMLEQASELTGQRIVVCAYVIANRHGMMLADTPDSRVGMPMVVPNGIANRSDIEGLLALTRQTWLGKEVVIVGSFKGAIKRDAYDINGWFFELERVLSVTEGGSIGSVGCGMKGGGGN